MKLQNQHASSQLIPDKTQSSQYSQANPRYMLATLNQAGNRRGLINLWAIRRLEVVGRHQSNHGQPIILFRVQIK